MPVISTRNLIGLVAAIAGSTAMVATAHAQDGGGGQGGPPPTSVHVQAIQRETLQERRRVTGALRSTRRARVATIESGLVIDVPIEEGQRLKAGEVIAVLDSRRLEIEQRRLGARATVLAAVTEAWEAELALEQGNVDALLQLSARQASHPKELADAEAEVRIKKARLEAASQEIEVLEAEAELVRIRLADKTIRAPFDGVVVATHTERGEWLGEGDVVADVIAVDAYEAWLHVPQRYAEAVGRAPEAVQVQIDATGRRLPPARAKVVPLVDPTARTFDLYVHVPDEKGILASGMSVTGWVPTGEKGQYLTVPRDAVMRNPAGFFVYVARGRPGGPAMATPVQLDVLFETNGKVTVGDGALREGDLVVVEGNERLFPMMPITPNEIGGSGGGGGATGTDDATADRGGA